MIFVCDMGDLFHETVPFEWIDDVFSVMSDLDQHIYILLTKRPERVLEFFCWKILKSGYNWRPKDNVWFGATIENQEQANIRIPYLLKIPASVRFVSIEPMLSSVSIAQYFGPQNRGQWLNVVECGHSSNQYGINWVICGGETGHKARPMHPDWVRSLRDQCKAADVSFFFKQWGEWLPVSTEDGKQYLPFADYIPETKFGFKRKKPQYKKDVLDGQQHHEWPKINL